MPAQRIAEFDIWRPGYGNASAAIYVAGTNTLAQLYKDEALTQPASNPQTLLTQELEGTQYGKFAAPLYTNQPYFIQTNSTEKTGVARPSLSTLSGQDASAALVTPTGGSNARTLEDLAGEVFYLENQGSIGNSAITNNTILNAAISAAAAKGGGRIILPAGVIAFTQLNLPVNVILEGRGRDVTVLQSQFADKVITLSGDHAGLARLTLDGVNLQAASVGVYGVGRHETFFNDVMVKRFETGLYMKGGRRKNWRDLFIDNCTNGARLHGDKDAGNGSQGDEFRDNCWEGGRVTTCTAYGVDLRYVDTKSHHNTLRNVGFENNTGVALNILGARHNDFPGCWFAGNVTDLAIDDAANTNSPVDSTVIGARFQGVDFAGNGSSTNPSALKFNNTCQDVLFEGATLSTVKMTFTVVQNNIVAKDCIEDTSVQLAGDATKWTRCRSMQADFPGASGLTTDAAATFAWTQQLAPGQRGYIQAIVIGNERNGTDTASYHISRAVVRPGSTLGYINRTASFNLGDTITGSTSKATARIIGDSNGGTPNGTLTLRTIRGTFINGETITGAQGGSATTSGTVQDQNAQLAGTTTSLAPAVETDVTWNADFAVNGGGVSVQVTGAASKTIEWTIAAQSVLS